MAFVKVANLSDVPTGEFISVEVDGEPVALYNVDGNIYATRDECTHDGETLSGGTMDGLCVVCPRHGAKFDITTGEAKALPAVIGITTYEVKVEGDDIHIDID
jgi:nitrite reductase/ring-hydroxylating ferredoxin subunit